MSLNIYKSSSPSPLKGTTLIVPLVSHGNLPQLAVDLLVSSLSLDRTHILDSKYLIPVVGSREDGLPGITTPLELFGKPGFPFVFLQQRSPVIKSKKRDFISAFVKFVEESSFSSIILLAGLDLTNRPDHHMMTPTYYLLPDGAPTSSLEKTPLSSLATTIPPFVPPGSPLPHPLSATPSPQSTLPSSGITPPLLRALAKSSKVSTTPVGSILQYVLEGDNREDAFLLATVVARVIGLQEFDWKEPSSWKQGLFGAPHDQTLFG